MDVIGLNLGHDGGIAGISDGRLQFAHEAEKDSNPRHSRLGADAFMAALPSIGRAPDALAFSGWHGTAGGYFGTEPPALASTRLLGKDVPTLYTPHERAHILAAFAMSSLQPGEESYALVWEGTIGKFYYIDPDFNISDLGTALSHPGWRYSYIYYLADTASKTEAGFWERPEMAGKLLALAGVRQPTPLTPAETQLIRHLLTPTPHFTDSDAIFKLLHWDKFHAAVLEPLSNRGVETPGFRNFAFHYSNAIFECFENYAHHHLKPGRPLLIAGGCGLNATWNSRWRDSGFFKSVFVPPCTNNSGMAIGAAVDAQLALGGKPTLHWRADAGLTPIDDVPTLTGWTKSPLATDTVAERLQQGEIVAWLSGRYEMGPRALGQRSLLASATNSATKARLNAIEQRDAYRPIAAICLAADVAEHFSGGVDDRHLLFFSRARHDRLPTVVHDDGTAQVLALTPEANPALHELLVAVKTRTGCGVLGNASLNFKGRGSINRLSDALQFAETNKLRTVVVDRFCYTRI